MAATLIAFSGKMRVQLITLILHMQADGPKQVFDSTGRVGGTGYRKSGIAPSS